MYVYICFGVFLHMSYEKSNDFAIKDPNLKDISKIYQHFGIIQA